MRPSDGGSGSGGGARRATSLCGFEDVARVCARKRRVLVTANRDSKGGWRAAAAAVKNAAHASGTLGAHRE